MKTSADSPINLHGVTIPREWLGTHFWVLGASGSGKTNGIIKNLLRSCLAQGDAGIVFDIKGDLHGITREALSRCGRARDLVTLGIGPTDHTFNPLGDGTLTPHQLVSQLVTAMSLSGQSQNQRNSAEDLFWSTARVELLNALVELGRQSLIGTGETLTFAHLQKLRRNLSQPAKQLKSWAAEMGEIVSENAAAGLMEFANFPDSTRACVLSSATNLLAPFQRPPLSLLVTPTPKRPALNFNDIINQSKVLVITAGQAEHAHDLGPAFLLCKQALYRLVLSRPRQPIRQDNQVFVCLDVYTRMLTSADAQSSEHVVMEQARSSRVSFLLAAQNLSGLEAVGGRVVVDKLAALAGNFCFLQNTCPTTTQLAQRVLGHKQTFKRHESITPRLPPPLLFPEENGMAGPTVTSTMLVPTEEPVVSPSELAQLKPGEAYLKLLDGTVHRIQCTFE